MMILINLLALAKINSGELPQASATTATLADILNIAFGIVGAFALLMIVVSGLRYILAGDDAPTIAKAKNGVIYSLVGMVVAVSAQAIVYFVVRRV